MHINEIVMLLTPNIIVIFQHLIPQKLLGSDAILQ